MKTQLPLPPMTPATHAKVTVAVVVAWIVSYVTAPLLPPEIANRLLEVCGGLMLALNVHQPIQADSSQSGDSQQKGQSQ